MSQRYDYNKKTYVQPNDRVKILCPYSEVCCYMKLADRLMYAELHVSVNGYKTIQLFNKSGEQHSFPIMLGEAGFYEDLNGVYYYPPYEEGAGYEFGPEPK
jgi:hypothetical protein